MEKELKKELMDHIGQGLEPYAFKIKRTDQSFIKAVPGGRQAFHIAFIDHQNNFDVTADMAIRFDALEELINAENMLLSNKEKRNTYSIGVEVGNLVRGKQKRWKVSTMTDIPIVTASILTDFVQYALPYFDKYSILENAFELLSSEKERLNSPFHYKRAKNLVGMAFLLGMKNQLPELIEHQSKFLRNMKDAGLINFERFANKFC